MENINDPKNIMGMADIFVDDTEDINIEELERSIATGTSYKKKDDVVDFAADYDADIERLTKQFSSNSYNDKSYNDKSYNDKTNTNNIFGEPPDLEDKSDNIEFEAEQQYKSTSSYEEKPSHNNWQPSQPVDQHLRHRTTEELKQKRINYVLGVQPDTVNDTFIDEEDEGDEIAKIMEQIDLLKNNLEAEGIDLKRIPDISVNATKKEAKAVLRILQIKNDRLRYCDMFEEGILAAAYGLESMFDGKRVWFGTQIDLVGWPDSVKVKLRRMRYDTSTFVGELVRGYNINSGWRILFELLPSLFLYSRERRTKSSDNLISDDKYKNAINELNS
jgi:hypothetical protein